MFPLIEEDVLMVAHSPSGLRKLSTGAALACTHRVEQRRRLEKTGLNPSWAAIPWFPQGTVLKAPASILGRGVRILGPMEMVERLRNFHRSAVRFGVVEEQMEGLMVQQDGVIVQGTPDLLLQLPGLVQEWDRPNGKILKYRIAGLTERLPEEIVRRILGAVGLYDSPFCIEAIRTWEGWKVIEVHARLGEDHGLAEMLGGNDEVFRQIDQMVRQAVRERKV